MDKRKILIMSLLVLFVAAISLSAVSASNVKTKTIKISKKNNDVLKKLKNGDTLRVVYAPTDSEFDRGVNVLAVDYNNGDIDNAKHTKLTKVKVHFKNNKKIKVKTYKVKNNFINVKLIKKYTPYKVIILYKNK